MKKFIAKNIDRLVFIIALLMLGTGIGFYSVGAGLATVGGIIIIDLYVPGKKQ